MKSFAIKHIVKDRGPLSGITRKIRDNPYAFTSKVSEATECAKGAWVYVFEVNSTSGRIYYSLGYRFLANASEKRAGGEKWEGKFTFKLICKYPAPKLGEYFDPAHPLPDDSIVSVWLRSLGRKGAMEIPSLISEELEMLFSRPENGAKKIS